MHIPHTPESLLTRNDSKNPAATCRGLTTNGRPCRRGIAQTPNTSPSPSPQRRASSPDAFCWQHREQATPCASPSPNRFRPTTMKERTSVDSLVDRLGLLDVEQKKEERRNVGSSRGRKLVPMPVLLDPDVPIPSIEHSPPRSAGQKRRQKKQNQPPLFCCFGEVDEVQRAPRPMKTNPGRRTTAALPSKMKQTHLKPPPPLRPSILRDPSSKTGEFLALIPAAASPQLTAQLLAELAKPFSASDDEGYIYMFWLTSETLSSEAPSEAASTLLAPPSRPRDGQRRTSEVLSTFAAHPSTSTKTPNNNNNSPKKTMLLKIGRAQNVHRRLNQWTRQCGYNLSLIRYYPYHPTFSSNNENEVPRTPRKVPNANRIERLIHIELAAKRAQDNGKCIACGREHREWFEVDASREGVQEIDEVIRRWVDWGEKQT